MSEDIEDKPSLKIYKTNKSFHSPTEEGAENIWKIYGKLKQQFFGLDICKVSECSYAMIVTPSAVIVVQGIFLCLVFLTLILVTPLTPFIQRIK